MLEEKNFKDNSDGRVTIIEKRLEQLREDLFHITGRLLVFKDEFSGVEPENNPSITTADSGTPNGSLERISRLISECECTSYRIGTAVDAISREL